MMLGRESVVDGVHDTRLMDTAVNKNKDIAGIYLFKNEDNGNG